MGINLDSEPSVEKKSIPHIGRTILFLLIGLSLLPLMPAMCSMVPKPGKGDEKAAERSASFYRRSVGTLTEAFAAAELPRISYANVRITDNPGPFDPVHTDEGLLGIVNENVKPVIVTGGLTGGYVSGGQVYDAGGHPLGYTSAGTNGTEVYTLDKKLIGYLRQQDEKEVFVNPDGSQAGTLGERVAVIMSDTRASRLKALIEGYNFDRTNR
jgi:hypothetical protein